MMNSTVYDANKQPRRLGKQIGSGGQGEVFLLYENSSIVVKIFHLDKLRLSEKELREKISAQANMPEFIKEPFLAWPQIEVFDDRGEWIGYAMKKAKGEPLSKLAHPMLYLKNFPNIDRLGIVKILIHLLDLLKKLHSKGIYIGDINLGNFLADPQTYEVYFIDTDSYQVSNGRTVFHCPVGKPEMTPVEHHGKDFHTVTRTVESDLFSLAILMFQCLMLGQHPYSQIGGGNPVENLRKGNFPYGRGTPGQGEEGGRPPGPWHLIWSHLTFNVKSLFIRTLQDGINEPSNRATIQEWEQALEKYYWAMEKGYNEKVIRPSYIKPSQNGGSKSKSSSK